MIYINLKIYSLLTDRQVYIYIFIDLDMDIYIYTHTYTHKGRNTPLSKCPHQSMLGQTEGKSQTQSRSLCRWLGLSRNRVRIPSRNYDLECGDSQRRPHH